MKERQFIITEAEIYERLKAESGFTAHIRAAAGQETRLATLTMFTDDEVKIIDTYIPLAIDGCVMAIEHYLSPCTVTEESDVDTPELKKYNFTLMLPDSYPHEHITSLANAVREYVCNYCLQQWYILVKSDEANISALKAQSSMLQLRGILAKMCSYKKLRRRSTDLAGI